LAPASRQAGGQPPGGQRLTVGLRPVELVEAELLDDQRSEMSVKHALGLEPHPVAADGGEGGEHGRGLRAKYCLGRVKGPRGRFADDLAHLFGRQRVVPRSGGAEVDTEGHRLRESLADGRSQPELRRARPEVERDRQSMSREASTRSRKPTSLIS
jgi:hypothetical protein